MNNRSLSIQLKTVRSLAITRNSLCIHTRNVKVSWAAETPN